MALAVALATIVAGEDAAATAPPAGSVIPREAVACTDPVGPGIAAPPAIATGVPGYHAAWSGQSGTPTLCPGGTSTATVAFLNTGTLGWYAGHPGAAAFLGTSGPEPGQDRPSALGVDVGWPSPNRPAVQSAAYVGPGQISWFQFTVRAPVTPGTYRVALRPLIEGVQWMEDEGVYWTVVVKADDGSVATAVPAPRPPVPVTAAPVAAVLAVPRTYFPAIGSDGSRSVRVSSLMYHRVSWLPPAPDALRRDLTVSPADLEEHLQYLTTNGYHTITAVDLWWSLDTGKPLPPKPVLLSFDDGYVDHRDVVLPLLRRYGMVGTFAVTVNLVDKPGYMTRAMVRELADAGMDVESHATDHVSLNKLSYASQVYQLCTSRKILSEWTGKDVRHFVYPSGDYLPLPAGPLVGCGYLTGFRKDGGSIQSSNEMLALRRVRVRGQQGLAALLLALQQ